MPALPPERPGCPKARGGRRPLPDPAAIQLFLVPESGPPYDEDVSAAETAGGSLPARPPRDTEPWARDSAKPAERRANDMAPGTPRPPATVPGVPPGWENRFAQVLAETLAGARPPRQIVPWTTEEALRRIQRLGPRLASQQRPRVRRVLTSLPAPDVMEMAVVVGFGPRVKALAVRLEHTGASPATLPGRTTGSPTGSPGGRSADLPGGRSAGLPGGRAACERTAARWVCTAVETA